MVHGRIWLLGLYFELFPHNNNNNNNNKNNNNNNCYQALTCAGAAGKNTFYFVGTVTVLCTEHYNYNMK